QIPEPILNRMNVYQIEAPDAEGAARIAGAIYREIRSAHDWGRQFPEMPSATVLEKIATLTPREMRRAVQSGFGNAKLAGRSEMQPDDVQDPRAAKRQRIGF
ncbi:MAG: AAA family ATPase, partial [Burkholderiales bacterium]|nr:AAA family ATPase [Burkholderiales bacterium]